MLQQQQQQQHQQSILSRARLFCGNCDSSTEDEPTIKKQKIDENTSKHLQCEPDLSIEDNKSYKLCITSTPAATMLRNCPEIIFTPDEQDRKSMSPITRSTQRMTRAMQVR